MPAQKIATELKSQTKTETQLFKPRGTSVMLPHGGLPEVLSLHLLKLIERTGGKNGPIGKQFISDPTKEKKYFKIKSKDPLEEDHHEVAPGLVYKYRGKLNKKGEVVHYGRALWTITRFCASYCRFCTRGREVGMPTFVRSASKASISQSPQLSEKQVDETIKFLKKHKEINEVIVSGGDPLTAPQVYLENVIPKLAKLQEDGDLDIVRIGTRLPVHNPISIKDWHYDLLAKLRNPYLMVHINHSLELTPEVLDVLNNFRKRSGATVMSQTVFLKGVNDSVETLYNMFTMMAREGIRPYYVYQNDPVYWAQHFTVAPKKAIAIWEKLRPKLSGVAATARFVIDVPFGYGKIPLPEGGAWDFKTSRYKDFKGKAHSFK